MFFCCFFLIRLNIYEDSTKKCLCNLDFFFKNYLVAYVCAEIS